MVKAICRIDDTIPAANEPDGKAAPKTPEKDMTDAEKVLAELKTRRALLNKLISDGGNAKHAGDLEHLKNLKASLASTINELDKLLNSTEIDKLSAEAI